MDDCERLETNHDGSGLVEIRLSEILLQAQATWEEEKVTYRYPLPDHDPVIGRTETVKATIRFGTLDANQQGALNEVLERWQLLGKGRRQREGDKGKETKGRRQREGDKGKETKGRRQREEGDKGVGSLFLTCRRGVGRMRRCQGIRGSLSQVSPITC